MDGIFVLTLLAVAVVLVFDFTNGFHDAANVVATVIASRAMSPARAVMVVGTFEFLGPLLGGTAVANTIGGFVDLGSLPAERALAILLAGLVGAIVWNLITWWRGLPSSSSHALVGGLIGATVLAAGAGHVVWDRGVAGGRGTAWRAQGAGGAGVVTDHRHGGGLCAASADAVCAARGAPAHQPVAAADAIRHHRRAGLLARCK